MVFCDRSYLYMTSHQYSTETASLQGGPKNGTPTVSQQSVLLQCVPIKHVLSELSVIHTSM